MKEKLSRKLRSGIAMLLVCCMIAGFVPAVAFATEAEETKTINYVSLGDSMTNGYGLTGYNGNSGVLDYGYGSSTNQFATWLVENDYADTVNHFQLALSAMRAEDLHWLLEVDYEDAGVLALIREMDENYSNRNNIIQEAINEGKLDADYAAALKAESSKKAYFEVYADRWNEVFSNGDSWTWRELIHDYRFTVVANYINYYAAGNTETNINLKSEWSGYNDDMSDVEALKIVAKYFQDAVADADIVSNGIGNGNFGVFILGRIQETIGFSGKPVETMIYRVEDAIRECDPAVQANILALKEALYAELENYVSVEGNELMEGLINSMVYGGLSYVLNWCGSVDAIVELNPDAEIVVMGLMNTMNGIKMEIGGVTIDIGQWMATMLDTLNAYMAGYPTVMQALGHYEDATFYYAVERQVQCYADTYNATINDGVVRDRFVTSIVGYYDGDFNYDAETGNYVYVATGDGQYDYKNNKYVSAWNDGLIWGSLRPVASSMGTELQNISLEDVLKFEKLTDAQRIAYATNTIDLNGNALTDEQKATARNDYMAMSISFYLAAEKAILRVLAEGGVMSADAAVALGAGTLTTDSVVALFNQKLAEYTPANIQRVCEAIGAETFAGLGETKQNMLVALFAMPDALGDALAEDKDIGGLLNLWAHCLLGNGLSGHPSQGGHDQLAAAIEETYATGHTAQDQTLENVEALMDELYKLVQTYGPEVAAQVWEQWVEYGYVDAVETSIEELEAMLTARYEYYTSQALPAIEAAVKSLNDQKAALFAQLEALNAELDAKKAELEQLIDQQVGAALDAYEAARAELEAAIAEIEAAIENVKSLIEDVETEISEIMDAANDVVNSVKELESVLQDVAQSAATLKELIENVYDILTNADPEQAVDAFLTIFDTARNAVLSTAEALELAMGVANELAGEVDALVTRLVEDITTVYETVSTVLTECYDALPEDVKEILAGAVAAAGEALEAAKEELEEKLAQQIDAAKAEAEEKKAELEAACNEKLADIENELNAIAATIQAEAEKKCAELEAACNAKLAELEAKKAELEAELEQLNRELSEAAQEAAAEIQAKIDDVSARLEQVKAEIEDVLAQIQDAYDQAVAEVEAFYADSIAALEKAAADARAELEAAVAEVEKQLTAAIESLKTEAEKQLKELTDAANEAIAGLEEISGELSEDLEAYLNDLSAELAKAEAALEEILSGSKEAVEDLMEALEAIVATGEEELTELVDKIVTTVNTMLYQSTHADLTIDDDFRYVALGDGSSVAEGYVELLAKYLNEEATSNGIKNDITYTNYAAIGNTVADELKDLTRLAARVADADLITLGYSNITFLSKALAGPEVDWAQYVGEEYAPYIEQLVAELKAELLDSGLSEDTSAYYTAMINALAFSVVQYAVEMPMLVGAIHEINPDAVVVIVGMYNPLSGVSFDTGDGIIDLGEYVDYLVEAVAVHGLAYAMISGNAIYVDARDVQTGNTATLLENSHLLQLIATQFEDLYPSAAGDQYIADQVADALNLSYETSGLWGDANMDGKVTPVDASLVLQYYTETVDESALNLAVCDVNGDGKVTPVDASMILQYYTEIITKFPVEG